MFLPALPNKYSQLLLVTGPFSSHPHQVLFDDSAFKYDRFGEDFSIWLYIYPLSAHTSVCDNETLFWALNTTTEERVGSASFILRDIDVSYVVLQFNLTLQGNWAVYTKVYDKNNLGKHAVECLHLRSTNTS